MFFVFSFSGSITTGVNLLFSYCSISFSLGVSVAGFFTYFLVKGGFCLFLLAFSLYGSGLFVCCVPFVSRNMFSQFTNQARGQMGMLCFTIRVTIGCDKVLLYISTLLSGNRFFSSFWLAN